MDLHGHLAQFEPTRDQLVQGSGDDERKELACWRCNRRETYLKRRNDFLLLAAGAIALDAGLNSIKQFLLVHRLGKEFNGPRLDGVQRHGDIAMSGDEYDGKLDI